MTLPITKNGIYYEVNYPAGFIYLLPIKDIHTEQQVKDAKFEVESKHITLTPIVDWQKKF